MAVPVLEAFQPSAQASGSTSFTLTAPSGIQAGELLVLIVANDSTATSMGVTIPSDWAERNTAGSSTSAAYILVMEKIADGTEGNVTLTVSSSYYHVGWYLRISGACGINVVGSDTTSGSTSSLSISQITTTVADSLAFYVMSSDGADCAPFGQPTGWTEQDEETSGAATGVGAVFGTKSMVSTGATGAAAVSLTVADGAAGFQFAVSPLPVPISQGTNTSANVAATSISATLPTGIAQNDLLLAFISGDAIGGTEIVSSWPDNWIRLGIAGSADTDAYLEVFGKYASASESAPTFNTASVYLTSTVWCIRGGKIDQVNTYLQTTGSTTHTLAGPITTPVDYCLAVYATTYDGADGNTGTPTNYTESTQLASGSGATGTTSTTGFRLMPTAGSTGAATFSQAAVDTGSSILVSIQPIYSDTQAYPKIEGYAETIASGTGTTLTLTAPASITAGELLLAIVMCDDDASAAGAGIALNSTAISAGWKKKSEEGTTTQAARIGLFYKIADGTEGSVGFVLTDTVYRMGYYLRVSGSFTLNPFSQYLGSVDTTSPFQIDGLTLTTKRKKLLIMASAFDGDDGDAFTVNSPFTKQDEGSDGSAGVGIAGFFATFKTDLFGELPQQDITAAVSDGTASFMLCLNAPNVVWPTGWARKCTLTIESDKVQGATNLINFPALLTDTDLPNEVLDSDEANRPQSNGYDIVFTLDSSGYQPIIHERVHYTQNATPASATAEFWLLIPDLDDAVDTTIYMWWKPSATITEDLSNGPAVFADYDFVSHDGGATDSTGNYSSTTTGTPTDTTNHLGVANRAKSFSAGVAEGYTGSFGSSVDLNVVTVQMWANKNNVAQVGRALHLRSLTPDETVMLIANGTAGDTWYLVADADRTAGDTAYSRAYKTATDSAWHYVCGVPGDSSGVPKAHLGYIYVDGSSTGQTTSDTNGDTYAMGTAGDAWFIGYDKDANTARDFEGSIGEVRWRFEALSADWIATEYNNQIDDGTFWITGTPAGAHVTEKAASDSLLPKITESRTNFLSSARSDGLAVLLSESLASLGTMTRSDTLRPKIDEISEIILTLARSDTLRPRIDEAVTLFVSLLRNDSLLPYLTDTSDIFKFIQIVTSDILYPMVGEGAINLAILYHQAVFDYLQIDIPSDDYTYSDVESLRENNAVNNLFKFPYQMDQYGVLIGDFNTYAGTSFGLGYATAVVDFGLIQIFANDTLYPKITEQVIYFLNMFERADAINPKITEAVINQLRSSRSDSISLAIAELTYNLLHSNRADTLLPKIVESLTSFVALSRQETLSVQLIEMTNNLLRSSRSDSLLPKILETFTILVSLARQDTLLPQILEFVNIFVSTSRSDTLLPKITETLTSSVALSRQDTLAPKILEFTNNLLMSSRSDALILALIESLNYFAFVNVSAQDTLAIYITELSESMLRSSRSDSILVKLLETITSFGVMSRQDTLAPAILEFTNNMLRSSRSDALILSLIETLTYFAFVGVSAQDTLAVYFVELSENMLRSSRSDAALITLLETITSFGTMSRQDNVVISLVEMTNNLLRSSVSDELFPQILETVSLLVSLSRTDNMAVMIEEISAIIVSFSASDTLFVLLDDMLSIMSYLSRSDNLAAKIEDSIFILAHLARADLLTLTINDISDLLAKFAASDSLLTKIDDIAELLWLTLEAFRWREDNGSETTATWIAAQDTTINRAKEVNTRLRTLLDTSSNAPALQLRLQYRRVGDPDWEWRDIE